ncbi:hypothetical protein [Pseudonocardia humida]|uniref:Uncharacterized protein n=1 Tax=Pseudonocardia humida TaxID=2800819 RepID=A0ABT1A119_9PSEU|nr:hypothetical protein [Pseudonocardia humida]MCO1656509.1 hypothetical protein [Pseudonocardia humida]
MDDIRFGVDIGRVIIAGPDHPGGGDTAFFTGDEATMLATPEVPGAVDALARLVERSDGRVWLVSKCGPRVQDRTRRWLAAHDVFGRTGIDPAALRFCLRRPQKRDHCLDLGLTDFVDDRPDVHDAIRGAVRRHYLFGPQRGPAPDYVEVTQTWADVLDAVERSSTSG